MIHAEIDLPIKTYKGLERIAQARKQSTAQVMRELITHGLASWSQPPRPEGRGLGKLADLGLKGPHDFAERLDDYLYGGQ